MNKTILIIIIVIAIIIGGYFLLKSDSQAPTSPSTLTPEITSETIEEGITIIGTEFAFSPSTITVQAGQQIQINFQNTGNVSHNLIIEELEIGTKTIRTNQTDTIEFTAPTSGTYTIFCSLPGHRTAGMEATLKVI